MSRLNYNRLQHSGKAFEPAINPRKQKAKGGWTHIKQSPVKVYTEEEKQAYLEGKL